jgi:hypothetical protein
MTMRILFIIDGLPGGGAEKVVLTLAETFLRQGDEVSLFSLRDVCEYPLPDGLDYRVIADKCRKPWRKLTEISRRARQLDDAVVDAERGVVSIWCYLTCIKPIALCRAVKRCARITSGSVCMACFQPLISVTGPALTAG